MKKEPEETDYLSSWDLAKIVADEVGIDVPSASTIIEAVVQTMHKIMVEDDGVIYLPPLGFFHYIHIPRYIPSKKKIHVTGEFRITHNKPITKKDKE